ncbi:MAG: PEGA domain-containing protein [Acidobacteriota bacterium]
MEKLVAPFRAGAAACALALSIFVFSDPLLTVLPPTVATTLDAVPGLGSSRGFVAQILSEPTGASVRIDGVERGTTPFFGNVQCRAGSDVEIEVAADGYATWRRELPCREGDTLKATARLER